MEIAVCREITEFGLCWESSGRGAGQADGPHRAALDKIARPLYTSVCFLYGFGPCE